MSNIVMILTNGFSPDNRVYKEAKYLVSKGHNVDLLCWDREGEFINRLDECIDGIKIKRFHRPAKYGTGMKQFQSYLSFMKDCKNYLKNINNNNLYIHCHDLDGILIGIVSKKEGAKLIFDMHEFYENSKYRIISYIKRLIVKYCQKRSFKIIYLNERQKSSMSLNELNKLIYLPNFCEKRTFSNCEKTYSKKFRVSYIGSVRFFSQLKALMVACSIFENVEVYIHGSGTSYKDLIEEAKKYSNCYITGHYMPDNSIDLYNDTDLLFAVVSIKNSNWKSALSTKLYESILSQTPIICSEGSASGDFCKNYEIGFTINDENIVEETRAIIKSVINDPEILDTMSTNMSKIKNNYTWESIVGNLDKIYG